MQYAVNVYAVVRVKITHVEAASPEEAVKAVNQVHLGRVLENNGPIDVGLPDGMSVDYVCDAEEALRGAVVDPILPSGEVDYDNTVNFEAETIEALVNG